MRSLLKSKKAQFFVLSALVIVSIIYFVSKWVEPYTIIDTSSIVLSEEIFVFNNIKEKSMTTVKISRNCNDLRYSLEEFEYFVKDYSNRKNYKIDFDYAISPCYDEPPLRPVIVKADLRLKSPTVEIYANYSVGWVPPS